MIPLLVLWLAFGDVSAVKAEPDMGKRSELALTNADHDLDEARQAYAAGDQQTAQSALKDLTESVDLCYDALQNAHTPPRKSKYYKRAELKLMALMRRVTGFRDEADVDERPPIEAALKKVSDVHDQVIADIMSKKK